MQLQHRLVEAQVDLSFCEEGEGGKQRRGSEEDEK